MRDIVTHTSLKKTQDYNGGVSGSSETARTDIENNSLWSRLVTLNTFFYAQTATLQTKIFNIYQ